MKRQLWDGAVVVCLSLVLLGVFPRCSLQSVVGDSLTSSPDPDAGQRRDGEVGDESGFGDQVDGPSRQTRSTAGSKTHAQTEAAYQQYLAKMQSGNFPPADPNVLCGDNAINVKIGLEDSESLYVFAPDGVPLSFSDLPPGCKTDVLRMPDAVVLIAQYDGCFVQAQGSAYVLRLRWYGEPIEAACPREEDPLIICYQNSMQVLLYGEKLEETVSANVNGWWTPLGQVSAQCRFGLGRSPGMLSLSAAFHGCGMTQKNGLHTLHLQSEDRDMSLSCPSGPAIDGPPAVKDPQPSAEPADQFPREEKRYRSLHLKDLQSSPESTVQFPFEEKQYRSLPPKDLQSSPESTVQFPFEEKQYRSLPPKDLQPSPEPSDPFPFEEKQYRSLPPKDLQPSPEPNDPFPLEEKQYRSLPPKDPHSSPEPADHVPLEEKQYSSFRFPQSLLEPISDERLPVPPFSEVPTNKPAVPQSLTSSSVHQTAALPAPQAPYLPNNPAASQSHISSSFHQDGTTLPFPANQSPPQPPATFVSSASPTFMQVQAPTMLHQQTPQHKLPQTVVQSPQQIPQAFAQSQQQQMPQAMAQSHQQAPYSVAQSPQQHLLQGFTHSLQQVSQGMVQSHQQTPASAHSAQYVPQTITQSPQKVPHAFAESPQQQVPQSLAQSPLHPSLQFVSQSVSKHVGGPSQQPLVKPPVSEKDPQWTQMKGDAIFPSFGPQTLVVPQNTLASQMPKPPPVVQTLVDQFLIATPKTPDTPDILAPQQPDAGKGQQPVSTPWKPGFPVADTIGSKFTKWFSKFQPGTEKPGSGQIAQVPGTGQVPLQPGTGMIAQQVTSTLGAKGVTGYPPRNEDQLPQPANTQAAHTSPAEEQLSSQYTKWLSHFQRPSTAQSSAQALLPQHMAQVPQQVSQQPVDTKDTNQPQAKVPQVSQALQQVNSQNGNGMSMFVPSTLQAAASIQELLNSQISQQSTSIQATQQPHAQVPQVPQQQQTGQVQFQKFPDFLPSPSQTQTAPQEPSKGQLPQQSQMQVHQEPSKFQLPTKGLLAKPAKEFPDSQPSPTPALFVIQEPAKTEVAKSPPLLVIQQELSKLQVLQVPQQQQTGQVQHFPNFLPSPFQTQIVPQEPSKGQFAQQSQVQAPQKPESGQLLQVPQQHQTGQTHQRQELGQTPDFHLSYSQTQTVPQYPPKGQLPQQSQSQVTQVHQEPSKVQVPQVPEQQQIGQVQVQKFPDFLPSPYQTLTVPQEPSKGQFEQQSQVQVPQIPEIGQLLQVPQQHQTGQTQQRQEFGQIPDFHLSYSQTQTVPQYPPKGQFAQHSQVQVPQIPEIGQLLQVPQQHQTGQTQQRQEFGQIPDFHLSYSQMQTVPQYPPKGQLPQQSQSQVTQVHQEPSKVQVPQVPEQQQTVQVQVQKFPDFLPSPSQTQSVPQYPPKGQLPQHFQIQVHQEPSKFQLPTKGQLTQPPKGFPDSQLSPSPAPLVTQDPAKTEVAKFPPFPGIHMEPFRVHYSRPSQNAKDVAQPQKMPEAEQVPKQPTLFYTPVAQSGFQVPSLPQFVSPVSVPQKQEVPENIKGFADFQPSPSPARLGLLGSLLDQLHPFAQQPQDQMPQSAVHVQQQAPEVNEVLWDTKWPSKFQQGKTEIPTVPQKQPLAISWPLPVSNVVQKDVQQQKLPDVKLPVSSQSPTYIEYKYPKPLLHLLASSLLHGPTTPSVAKKPQFPAPATSGSWLPEAQTPSSASKGQQQQVLYTPSAQGQQQQVLYTSHGQTNLWNYPQLQWDTLAKT